MADNTETRTIEILVKANDANASIKDMSAGMAVMNNQLNKMSQDDPGREKLLQDWQQMKKRVDEANAAKRTYIKTEEEQRAEEQLLLQTQEKLNQENQQTIATGSKLTASYKEMKAAASLLEAQLSEMSQDDPGRAALQRDFALLGQRIEGARVEMKTYIKTAEELEAEQQQLAEATARAAQENLKIVVDGKKVTATYHEMDAAAKLLEKDIKDLTPGTEAFIKKSKELQEVKGRMEEVDKSIKGTEKSTLMAKLGLEGITSASGLMKAGFQAAMAALLPLLAIEKLWELVQGFVGLVNEVDKVKASINSATGAQGTMLDTLYVKVQALSKTFGEEYTDVLKGADVLAKQMGISHEEAFDIMQKGYQAGANRSGEFLDNIKEYSVQFKDAGYSAEEFITHISQSELGGVFSDKGADTVKEFGLRIREQTVATSDAMDAAFGQEFTNRIFKGINDGSMTVKQALVEVSTAMDDTRVPASKLQTVVADVFGGPGEDAGLDYLKSLHKVGEGLDSLVDKSNMYVQQQQALLDANTMLAESEEHLTESFSGTGNVLETTWTKTKAVVLDGIGYIIDGYERLFDVFDGVEAAIKQQFTTAGRALAALKSGDFAGVAKIYGQLGNDTADAFNKAYSARDRAKRDVDRAAEVKQAQDDWNARAQALAAGFKEESEVTEKTRKEKAAAEKKAAAQALAQHKKHLADLKKAQEEAARAQQTAQMAAEDMQVAAIRNKYDREIADINLQTNRKMATLAGSEAQIMEQWEMMEAARQERIQAVRDAQKEEEEKKKKEKAEADEQARLEAIDKQIALDEAEDEEQAAKWEQAVANGLMREQEYQDALWNLKKAAMENQLLLLEQAHGKESAQYKKFNAQKIKEETAHIKKEKDQKQDLRDFDQKTQIMAAGLLKEGLAAVEDNLNKKSAAYQVFKMARKAAELVEIGMNMISELQYNARNAAADPLNLIPGGAVLVQTQLGIKNGLTVARALGAGIKVAAFKKGGNTTKGTDFFSVDQMGALLSGGSGGSLAPRGTFAGGGGVNQPTIGLIGEAGPELVIPNWMYSDPKQADLMGFLEAQIASRGNAFASGGTTVAGYSPVPTGGADLAGVLGDVASVLRNLDSRLQGVEDWATSLEVNQNLLDVARGLRVVEQTQNGGGIRKGALK